MKILELPLKKEWYDMIESGEKREEYREIKPHWSKRFVGVESLYSLTVTAINMLT